MTTDALYYQTKLRLNRLGTGVGMNLEPAVWVTMYNAAQTQWWKLALQTRSDSVIRDQLGGLLVTDLRLEPYRQDERVYRFKLPDNLYQPTGVYVTASTKSCTRTFPADPRAPQWIADNWHNPLARPDFDWEETVYVNQNTQLLVYYQDFSIQSILLSYYQSPQPVDLPGYIKLDGTPGRLINTDLPDELQQEVLDILIPMLQ